MTSLKYLKEKNVRLIFLSRKFFELLTPKLAPIQKNYQNLMASPKIVNVDLTAFRSC